MVHGTTQCVLLPPPELPVGVLEVGLHFCIAGGGDGAVVDQGAAGWVLLPSWDHSVPIGPGTGQSPIECHQWSCDGLCCLFRILQS
eukprot:8757210-Ditylum_brightwellii.AAC.1